MRIMPAVLLLAALSGCGLKGDLYLPQPQEPAVSPPDPQPIVTESSSEEDPATPATKRAPPPR